jgi:hypothetical protein
VHPISDRRGGRSVKFGGGGGDGAGEGVGGSRELEREMTILCNFVPFHFSFHFAKIV